MRSVADDGSASREPDAKHRGDREPGERRARVQNRRIRPAQSGRPRTRTAQHPDDLRYECRKPGDHDQREHPHQRTAKQQGHEEPRHACLQEHRADPQARPAGHRRRQDHRQQPVRHTHDHHRGPADRGQVRVGEDVREHEPRQKVIDLVESDEHAHRRGAEDVHECQHDVRADGPRKRGGPEAPNDVDADRHDACADGARRPCHARVVLHPEVRHHADDADEDQGKRGVIKPRGRDPHAQGDRPDEVERAEDGRGDPAERHQVDDAEHSRVIEETRDATRIQRDRAEIDREQAGAAARVAVTSKSTDAGAAGAIRKAAAGCAGQPSWRKAAS